MNMAANSRVALLGLAGVAALTLGCRQEYGLTGHAPSVHPDEVTECGFTPISGTKISRYDCNPVFAGTAETWGSGVGSVGFHATEVLGHPFYQMWYSTSPQGAGFGEWGLGYAISGSGTRWEAHAQNPLIRSQTGQWDQDSLAGQVVVWDSENKRYVMAYQGFTLGQDMFDSGIWGLGIATSSDGVAWSKHPANPVIDFNDFDDDISPCWPLTITGGGSGFRGYIAAADFWESMFGETRCEIYAMSALDLGTWSLSTRPILTADHWYEASGIASASIVEFEGIQYMFYIGFEDWIQGDGFQSATRMHFNLATSNDGGMTWHKDPTNPMPINLTSPGRTSAVGAQVVGGRIHLWVTDFYEEEGSSAVGYFLYEPNDPVHP